MSRAAVLELLQADPILSAAPYNLANHWHPTYQLDGTRQPSSNADGYFGILRWEEEAPGPGTVTTLSVWIHRSMSKSTDFLPLRAALVRVITIMTAAVHIVGSNGDKMTQCKYEGMGGDFNDQGYQTITKYAAFKVLSGERLTG